MSGHDPLGTSQASSQATSQQGPPTEALGRMTSQLPDGRREPPELEPLPSQSQGKRADSGSHLRLARISTLMPRTSHSQWTNR